jgi:DNA-binding HxlR family transcriptional regulator
MAKRNGYGQFCPVALAATILAERWTPLVVRELLCGSVRFNEIRRGVPRMSSALLAQRLKQLQFAGVVERLSGAGGVEYCLTPAGRELFPVIREMGLWSQRWLRHDLVDTDNLDSDLLMWDIRRNVAGHMPDRPGRYVAEFRLSGVPVSRRFYWLVFDGETVDLCYRDPGFEVDLFSQADLRELTRIWLGHVSISEAIRDGRLRLDGTRADIAAFRSWFVLSPFARGRRQAGHGGD